MKLALCMLVKNIEARMGFVCSILDNKLYDEIIIVDNGSTDNTANILLNYGYDVIRCPDKEFDQCRNEYLDKCSSDWILVLDSDEYVIPSQVIKFKETDYIEFDAAKVRRFDYYGDGLWSESNLYRLFRNRKEIRYDDAKIHASISSSLTNRKKGQTNIQIHHYDVFFNQLLKKNSEYIRLTNESLSMTGNAREKAYFYTYLAMEYYGNDDAAVFSCLENSLKMDNQLLFAKFLLSKQYIDQGKMEIAKSLAEELIISGEPLYINRGRFLLAEISIRENNYERAEKLVLQSLNNNASASMYINYLALTNQKFTEEYRLKLLSYNENMKNRQIYNHVSYKSKYEFTSMFLGIAKDYVKINMKEFVKDE